MSDCCFILYKTFKSEGAVYLMDGLDRSVPDYNDLLSIACFFAKKGHVVKILAPVHFKDSTYRKVFGGLVGTRFYRKCPDLLIDNDYYEYESYERPFKSRKVSHMIKRGALQADRIIIDNNKGASDRFIINMIQKRLTDKFFHGEIEELYVYEKGGVRRLFKKSGRE